MNIIIDIECFDNNIIKELGFCNGKISRGFAFLPPYSYSECTEKEKRTNSFCTRNRHLLGWNAGHYAYAHLENIVKDLTYDNASYFAKGHQKCLLLSKLFNKPFTNLEEYGCPKVSKLPYQFKLCSSYPDKHKLTMHCAQKKAETFYDWFDDLNSVFAVRPE